MSRIGRLAIPIPQGVSVEVAGSHVAVSGPKGTLERDLSPELRIIKDDGVLRVERPSDEKRARELHGLTRTLLANMVIGVTDGFRKSLEITGVGYRAQVQGKDLNLSLGYSHEVKYAIPSDIKIECPKPTEIVISGADKQKVGQVAAEIREFRKPEPYKGKGVKYSDEYIHRKEGKKK